MNITVGYRLGNDYFLSPPSEDAEQVTVFLKDGIRVEPSAVGRLIVYREHLGFGMSLRAALKLGWCWLAEEEERAADQK